MTISRRFYAFGFEAEIDGDGCKGIEGDDGYWVEMLNTDVEKPTGGVNTGIYYQQVALYVYTGADQLPL